MKWLFISPLLRNFAVPTTYTETRDTAVKRLYSPRLRGVSRFVIVCGWRLYYQVGGCFFIALRRMFSGFMLFSLANVLGLKY